MIFLYKVPPRDVVDLRSRYCRKLKKGNTDVSISYVHERCDVHWCCTAAAAAVVPLLYCADAFAIQRKSGLELSHVVFRMARPHNAHRHTQRHRS